MKVFFNTSNDIKYFCIQNNVDDCETKKSIMRDRESGNESFLLSLKEEKWIRNEKRDLEFVLYITFIRR